MSHDVVDAISKLRAEAKVPKRAGRCVDCNRWYAGGSLDVIRVHQKWRCVCCAEQTFAECQDVKDRKSLLAALDQLDADAAADA